MKIEELKPMPAVCRQSSIKCAYSCERKWFCQYRLGIKLRGGVVREGAELGSIYHKFQQLGPGRDSEVMAWVRDIQSKLMARVDKGEDLDGSLVRLANLLTELYHKAEAMAHLFWERYPQPSYLRTIGTEIKVSTEFDGLVLEGTIDKLLENTQDSSIWIRDHKSTGRSLESIMGGLAWSLQARMYRLLATSYLGQIKIPWANMIRGFIFDGILKPGIKSCKTDIKNAKDWNCSVEDAYLRRVKEWYQEKDKDAMLSKSIIFAEDIYPDELRQAFSKMQDLFGRPMMLEAYSKDITRKACFEYERQCIYHDLCDAPLWRWDELFQTKYKFEEAEEPESENE